MSFTGMLQNISKYQNIVSTYFVFIISKKTPLKIQHSNQIYYAMHILLIHSLIQLMFIKCYYCTAS